MVLTSGAQAVRIIHSADTLSPRSRVSLTRMSMILLEGGLLVAAVAFFVLLDLYVRGLEKL
jgi:hypothetical protein